MIILGIFLTKKPPAKISSYGYRTKLSMKNSDTWRFANVHCGKIWLKFGTIFLPITAIIMLFSIGKNEDAVGKLGSFLCAIQTIPIFISIFLTEKALKNNFDENGEPKFFSSKDIF